MDPGVDDALALLLALHSPELEIVGLTTVAGNIGVEQTTRNMLTVLEVAGVSDPPPVAMGAAVGLSGPIERAEHVHGRDGLGGAVELRDGEAPRYPEPKLRPAELSAEELIVSAVREHGQELTIIATGPLTNIARALSREPRLLRSIQELIIMGGAFAVPGNVTNHAEFNVSADPQAAAIVARAGGPTLWVGLDVTHKTFLFRRDVEEEILPRGGRVARFVADCTAFYMDRHRSPNGAPGCYLHDPLAVAVAIDRTLVGARPAQVEVVVEGEERGRTIARWLGTPGPCEPRGALVCTTVDTPRFRRLFLERITGPPEQR